MKPNKSTTKTKSYLLANHEGVEIYLSTPGKESKDQKYFIDYNSNGRKKYYGEGSVKRRSIEFFKELNAYEPLKHSQIEAQLAMIFKADLELIISKLQSNNRVVDISMRS